jgi:transcriptional regulator with XRE-family HTH domain
MYPKLAELLTGARIRQGLSQDAVAHEVEVKQQTVSRWEQGRSRPRRVAIARLASALAISEADIKEAAAAATSQETPDVPPTAMPVRPRTPNLPFSTLSEKQFEYFITDLAARLYPGADVHQLGGQGDDQKGYDVLVVHPDGRRMGIQCKRENQFGPAKVQKAIQEAELDVDTSVIALSRPATNATRDELEKNRHWLLWDQLDLSRSTRRLADDDSLTLVRTYFPSHIEAFLGLPQAGPWMVADEYFRGDPLTLLNHRQELIGRSHIVHDLSSWAAAQDERRLAIVVGRGGVGKSKLLWEVATQSFDAEVHFRFISVDQSTTPRDFDLLPRSGTVVVVIDDQYNVEHVARIASQLWKHRANAKLLVAIRPDSETVLNAQIWTLGRVPDQQARWELGDLSHEDACQLVSSLIDRPIIHPLTRQLAAISADCPLIAVVAADLLRTGALSGSAFQNDRALRAEVLRRFSELRSGQGSSSDIAERRNVLVCIAAYQPVRLNDDNFAHAIRSLTGVTSWDQIRSRIRELEDAGLILRRDDALRVVPDMLGDVALGEAAYDDRASRVTDLMARAQAAATGKPLEHLLVNASRMEWQIREGSSSRVYMVDELWRTITSEAVGTSYGRQIELLHSIVKAAFYQPRHAFEFVTAVFHDVTNRADSAPDGAPNWGHSRQHVLNAVPPVLRNIAYNFDHLRTAADLLWDLAQEDSRALNQHPEHPLRILQALARLSYARPLIYIDSVISAAEQWLTLPYKVSPFEVLESVLAVEGSEELWSEKGLTFYSFPIPPDRVRALRQRVTDMAVGEAVSAEVPAAVRGIQALETAIKEPHGAFGRTPSADEIAEWRTEFVSILEVMRSIGARPELDPAVRLAIRQAVQWHATYGAEPTKRAAIAVLDDLYNGADDDLSRCLHSYWRRLDMRYIKDYAAAEEAVIREDRRVIHELMERGSFDDVLDLIETRILVEQASFESDGSTRFFWNLFTLEPDLATRVCESTLAGKYAALAQYTPQAVAALINTRNVAAIDICTKMLATDDLSLHRYVAAGLASNRTQQAGLLPGELSVLRRLAESLDPQIQAAIGRAAYIIGLSDTDTMHAYELLSRVQFGNSSKTAAEVLQGFNDRGPLRWAEAGQEFADSVLAQLVECTSIDEYMLLAAVSELSAVAPLCVTRMLLNRIERSANADLFSYKAMPHHWQPSLRVSETSELGRCLVEIREWIRDQVDNSARRYAYSDAAELFSLTVGEWSAEALASLGNVSNATSNAELVSVACILAHAPYDVLFSNTSFVAQLLQRAEAFTREECDSVFSALLPTNYEVVVVWSGSPDQKEIETIERARQIAGTMPAGSIERRFFETLAADIESRTSFLRERSDGFEDHRDW